MISKDHSMSIIKILDNDEKIGFDRFVMLEQNFDDKISAFLMVRNEEMCDRYGDFYESDGWLLFDNMISVDWTLEETIIRIKMEMPEYPIFLNEIKWMKRLDEVFVEEVHLKPMDGRKDEGIR